MAKEGNEAELVPSVTVITILEKVPVAVGVPDSRPVVVLNAAHVGRLAIENVNGSLLGSDAVGVNEYAVVACTDAVGVPLITGLLEVGGVVGEVGGSLTALGASSADSDAQPLSPTRASNNIEANNRC